MSAASDINKGNCKKHTLEAIAVCQVVAIFTVILACIINLSLGEDKAVLWSSLLSGSLGYLLPAPKVKGRNVTFLPDTTQQQQYGLLSGQHIGPLCNQTAESDSFDGRVGGCTSREQHTTIMVHASEG